jgi:hypothetical protein
VCTVTQSAHRRNLTWESAAPPLHDRAVGAARRVP